MAEAGLDGPPGEVFRDSIHGAQAKREQLLRERRIQVSTQPLFVRALYVRQFARVVTGLGLFAGALVLLVAGSDRDLYRFLSHALPGQAPAPLATLFTGMLFGGFTLYFVARSWAERRYTQAMKKAITETHDVYDDVNRLATEHPDQVGRAMAERLSMWSRALPMIALMALGPLVYLFLKQAALVSWPTTNWLDHELMAASTGMLPLVLAFSALTVWLCRGFRAGRQPARLWRPAAYAAALLVPALSSTLCLCNEASKAIGLAGVTIFFAIGTAWAHRKDGAEPDPQLGELGQR